MYQQLAKQARETGKAPIFSSGNAGAERYHKVILLRALKIYDKRNILGTTNDKKKKPKKLATKKKSSAATSKKTTDSSTSRKAPTAAVVEVSIPVAKNRKIRHTKRNAQNDDHAADPSDFKKNVDSSVASMANGRQTFQATHSKIIKSLAKQRKRGKKLLQKQASLKEEAEELSKFLEKDYLAYQALKLDKKRLREIILQHHQQAQSVAHDHEFLQQENVNLQQELLVSVR
jgi:hypothetical protein